MAEMKSQRLFEPHLVLKKVVLPPGGEWKPSFPGWCLIQVSDGVAYWLQSRLNQELPTGSVLVISNQVQGTIRASQVGAASLECFWVQPERLTGLATLAEQQLLERAATQERLSFRLLVPNDPVAEKFKTVVGSRARSAFHLRLQLLQLFIESFGNELNARDMQPSSKNPGAKGRLEEFLRRMPAAELLDLDFTHLVDEMGCTARHLSRTFHAVVGMSFRDKQTEVRLMRARELLATTRSKVLEVALESGYESLSLFNLMFKRRFGVSPGKWREQIEARKISGRRPGALLALARM